MSLFTLKIIIINYLNSLEYIKEDLIINIKSSIMINCEKLITIEKLINHHKILVKKNPLLFFYNKPLPLYNCIHDCRFIKTSNYGNYCFNCAIKVIGLLEQKNEFSSYSLQLTNKVYKLIDTGPLYILTAGDKGKCLMENSYYKVSYYYKLYNTYKYHYDYFQYYRSIISFEQYIAFFIRIIEKYRNPKEYYKYSKIIKYNHDNDDYTIHFGLTKRNLKMNK